MYGGTARRREGDLESDEFEDLCRESDEKGDIGLHGERECGEEEGVEKDGRSEDEVRLYGNHRGIKLVNSRSQLSRPFFLYSA